MSFPPHQRQRFLKRCRDRFLSQKPLPNATFYWCAVLDFCLKYSFVIHVWKKTKQNTTKQKNINEYISYFVAAGIVTHCLIWLELAASFTFVLWNNRTISGAILPFKRIRKAKIETSVPLMEIWSCVLVHHLVMASVPQQGQRVSFWWGRLSLSLPFLGGRLLAMMWVSFISTDRLQ